MATVSSFKESHVRWVEASWGGERCVKIRIFQTIRRDDGCSSSKMTRYSAMSSPVVFVMSWLCSDEIVSTTEKSFRYRVFSNFESDSSPPLNFANPTFRRQIFFSRVANLVQFNMYVYKILAYRIVERVRRSLCKRILEKLRSRVFVEKRKNKWKIFYDN